MRASRTRFDIVSRQIRRAFTMIEVMAVVVILAGIWMLVLPNFGSRDDLIAGSAARVLISDLLYAQNLAISTQTVQYVSFTVGGGGAGNGGYTLYNAQPFTTPITDPVSQKPYTVTFGTGSASQFSTVMLSALSIGPNNYTVLAFNEYGQPMACSPTGVPAALTASGTITLASGAQTVVLTIEPDTGNLTLP
jgi:prepilin-type N-terminal cleavage/methylation domain-containing protein